MESDNNREFDRLMKAKLDTFEPEVPASMWDAIEKNLPVEEKPRKLAGGNRFRYSWAIAASLLLIGFSFWQLQPEEKVRLRAITSVVEETDPSLVRLPTPQQPATRMDRKEVRVLPDPAKGLKPKASPRLAEVSNRPGDQVVATEAPDISEPELVMATEFDLPLAEEVAFAPTTISEVGEGELDIPYAEPEDKAVVEKGRPRVVSSVLNFLASNIQIGSGGTVVEFSETEHGVLKVDIKGISGKNNQGL